MKTQTDAVLKADLTSRKISDEVRDSLKNLSEKTSRLKEDIDHSILLTERLDHAAEQINTQINKFNTEK